MVSLKMAVLRRLRFQFQKLKPLSWLAKVAPIVVRPLWLLVVVHVARLLAVTHVLVRLAFAL